MRFLSAHTTRGATPGWHTFITICLLCLLPLLASCEQKTYAVGIRGYNHTDKVIGQFQINGGAGDSAMAPHSGGGSLTCCVSIPAKWKPGLRVTIRWVDGWSMNEQVRVLPVPEYTDETAGYFTVHFLRNGEVKVFSTRYALWHPNYPLKGEEAGLEPGKLPRGPWDR
ncbi:DUF3304 domain-containing protein [Luteimonas sp. A501]